MKITVKTTLLPAEFVGTRIGVRVRDDLERTYGIGKINLVAGETAKVDWGDGTADTLTADASNLTHVYPLAGEYEIRLTGGIARLTVTGQPATSPCKIYAKDVLSFFSNSPQLMKLNASAFQGCTNLTEFNVEECPIGQILEYMMTGCESLPPVIRFPCVTTITGSSGHQPFQGCTSLREIRFSEAFKDSITSSACYQADPHLGSPSAEVIFE